MKNKTFAAFISPSLVLMVLLMVIPLITALWLGFNFISFSNLDNPQFAGLQNYKEVLRDSAFWYSFRFTLLYIVVVVPGQILLGFVIALLLDQIGGKARGAIIAVSLIPFIITPVVGTLMFRIMFDRGGLYWYLLEQWFGYEFIMNTFTVKLLILMHGIWYTTPYAMITFFSGLQTLPQTTLEAARVDGANPLQRMWHVIIPHLRPLLLFISLMSIMDAYRIFDSILVITKQNPMFQADSLMYYNFKVALSFNMLGKANAMSIITVIGILFVLTPFLVITYRQQMEKL